MPRNVRNFYLKGQVDGLKAPISTGPPSKDGGFKLEIGMREGGEVSKKGLVIYGWADSESLHLLVSVGGSDVDGELVVVTER